MYEAPDAAGTMDPFRYMDLSEPRASESLPRIAAGNTTAPVSLLHRQCSAARDIPMRSVSGSACGSYASKTVVPPSDFIRSLSDCSNFGRQRSPLPIGPREPCASQPSSPTWSFSSGASSRMLSPSSLSPRPILGPSHCDMMWDQESSSSSQRGTLSASSSPPSGTISSRPFSVTIDLPQAGRIYQQKPFQCTGGACGFCKKNGETAFVFMSHKLHKYKNGQRIVECPVLRNLKCQYCGETGDSAHTASHCPLAHNQVSVALMLKNTPRNCNGKLRRRAPFK